MHSLTNNSSWTAEIWTDDTFHRDIKPESASKTLMHYFITHKPSQISSLSPSPPEPSTGHRCPPIPRLGPGTKFTQSDWKKGLLLHTGCEQGSRGPHCQQMPSDNCLTTTETPALGWSYCRRTLWKRNSKSTGLWCHLEQLITLPSGSTLPLASQLCGTTNIPV